MSRGRALTLALVAAALLAGGGVGVYLLHLRHQGGDDPPQTRQLVLPDLVVNLADRDRPRYLSLSLSFTLLGQQPKRAVEKRNAQIRDAVIAALTQHTYGELLSLEGKERLREDLLAAVQGALEEEQVGVSEAHFTSFLME